MDSSHHAGDSDAVSGNDNGAARISDLLAEGEAAFARKAYQVAIDAWSRIFLIDADNDDARRRIDEAQRQQAERARRVEEIFHDAVDRLEAGETRPARQGFEKVLALQPNHVAAREHLRRLDSGDDDRLPVPDSRIARELADPEPETRESRPTLATPARPVEESRAPFRRRSFGRAFLAIGGVVLLFAAAVGWLIYSQRRQLFPNAQTADPTKIGRAHV